jgi:hypothetical protein
MKSDGFFEQLARYFGSIPHPSAAPLSGGLDWCSVSRVCVTFRSAGSIVTGAFVAKHLQGRELEVYRTLRATMKGAGAPRLLGMHHSSRDMRGPRQWPWSDQSAIRTLVRRLALIHSRSAGKFLRVLADPDLESEKRSSAATTAEFYHQIPVGCGSAAVRPRHRAIDRIASDITAIRGYLMGRTRIVEAVLLDWGRARLGSPREGIASWLQSIAFREPQVRRLQEFRRPYCLAATPDASAGALRYHLAIVTDSTAPADDRYRSRSAANDWMRIAGPTDEYWRDAQTSARPRAGGGNTPAKYTGEGKGV